MLHSPRRGRCRAGRWSASLEEHADSGACLNRASSVIDPGSAGVGGSDNAGHRSHTNSGVLRCSKRFTLFLGHGTSTGQLSFYTQQLGFTLTFDDEADPPNYVGFRRDAVELHMQFQFEHEMSTTRLRLLVDDPDGLLNEYRQRGIECTANGIRDTPWGTREFAFYDLDRNALTFYRHLAKR